ncbi:hypothetical protein niasHT_031098 [Heterodera trifolii]|uniref:Uncharacterized protein n=1 Tax=Heterodera trifolii TaxID=157864 RepID=A0ABD2IPV5_9BILA
MCRPSFTSMFAFLLLVASAIALIIVPSASCAPLDTAQGVVPDAAPGIGSASAVGIAPRYLRQWLSAARGAGGDSGGFWSPFGRK